jgi:hypothetical protein
VLRPLTAASRRNLEPPALLRSGYGDLSFWVKRVADRSSPSNSEVKNLWRCTSVPQYPFMSWCKENFTKGKDRRKNKIQIKCVSHYSWKYQSLEITHGNRLSRFLPVLTFLKFITLPAYRLPTLLSATKEGFKALSPWCFSQSFPCKSGAAGITHPGTNMNFLLLT